MNHPCIYCRQIGRWTVEHVICRAFGTFEPNLTLTGDVCVTCNGGFARGIENLGVRCSLEGIHRILAGLVSPKTFRQLRPEQARLELEEPGWEGVLLAYEPPVDDDQPRVLPLASQVLLRRRSDRCWVAYTLKRLRTGSLNKDEYDLTEMRAYACTDAELAELREAMAAHGVSMREEGSLPAPPAEGDLVRVSTVARFDTLVQRLMAKIGFNFMAHQFGHAYALRSEFDEIREFILTGASRRPLVQRIETSLLTEERGTDWSRFDHHMVGLDVVTSSPVLRAQVSLFNLMRYEVALSWEMPGGIHRPDLPHGMWFDWRKRTTGMLVGVPADHLIQPARW
jgi:hypothetical protein